MTERLLLRFLLAARLSKLSRFDPPLTSSRKLRISVCAKEFLCLGEFLFWFVFTPAVERRGEVTTAEDTRQCRYLRRLNVSSCFLFISEIWSTTTGAIEPFDRVLAACNGKSTRA